ncbi:MAG TPA: BadF/BadG/BcrA/BcrD ATPase family protein, partial [Candidatus Ozemobacteraceae bacterium]|nr:BadF/BadG/BcrA/BcrD ATPase family protein [Candidatus Ozemobacteraceae bacterium]
MQFRDLTIGFDIGSVSINTIICDGKGDIIEELPYQRHFGKTVGHCAAILADVERKYTPEAIARVVFTGTHGETFAKALKTHFEVETTAQTNGLFKVFPQARTVVSIGGHDSALLLVNAGDRGFFLEDFRLNGACAAGTGSFIDQQAERIFADKPEFADISDPQERIEAILGHFIFEGSRSDAPANVACRCTVFTKSDMIHLQNKGIAIKHIIAGLHEGVAKNFKSTLITSSTIQGPVAFIGGYATNELARTSFEKILGLPVTVPPHHTAIGAIGVAQSGIRDNVGRAVRAAEIEQLSSSAVFAAVTTPPLCLKQSTFTPCGEFPGLPKGKGKIPVYFGFDIGSTTTKLVLISPKGDIYYKRYMPTEGQPVVAIKKGLRHLQSNIDVKRLEI